MSERTPVISLGAGVQSTALALMAAAGELDAARSSRSSLTHTTNPPPSCAT